MRESQLLEYITIRHYFLDKDTEYFFTMMLRMQCRGEGKTTHPQGERKEHLVFLFFLSRKKVRKTSQERRLLTTL